MPLVPGARLGAYEITAQVGVGGMGEVYRARDARLDRDVALKLLSDAFAADPDRLSRFEREAKTLAALNHPNIAQIFGVEEDHLGNQSVRALVMELVEGPTLAERIEKAALGSERELPLDEALDIAKQMVLALEAAHERGIIHRDLKPGNIKVRPDGTVKVLDFGLAKATEPAAAAHVSQLPTITTPAMTQAGIVLGTAAYMAPEQARGRTVTRQADIWAFGCVFYEMLAGKRAFDGEDVSDTIANVLKTEPDWTAISAEVPAAVRALLRRCLEKDPRRRVADISTARFVLEEAAGLIGGGPIAPVSNAAGNARPAGTLGSESSMHSSPVRGDLLQTRAVRLRTVVAAAAGLVIGGLLTAAALSQMFRREPPQVVRARLTTSGETVLRPQLQDRDIAITPDGATLVYRGVNRLLVRTLNQLEPVALAGLGVPRGVFISPDGRWIGFFDGPALKKVAITGGSPVTIVARTGGAPRGATWGPDDTIVFATNADTGLSRVSARGGEPVVLTSPEGSRAEDHVWPEFLPGGQAVLFTTVAPQSLTSAQIEVLDLRSGATKILVRGGSHAQYVPSGHLVYNAAGTIQAVRFDLDTLEIVGAPVPVFEGVMTSFLGAANLVVAANGTAAYVEGSPGGIFEGRSVVVVDRKGIATSLAGLQANEYRDVAVSPDGRRVALATQQDVWVYDFARATLTRLTVDVGEDTNPLWSPDGQRIAFKSLRAGYPQIFWRPADGSGTEEQLLPGRRELIDLHATDWSADGARLVFGEVVAGAQAGNACTVADTPVRRLEPHVLVQNGFCNGFGVVSPDGRWIAYFSNVSGRNEIYVERYPQMGNRQQISAAGGIMPLWSRNGEEIFFRSLDDRQVLSVSLRTGEILTAARPQVLFEMAMSPRTPGTRPYDVTPDGRFVIIRDPETRDNTAGAQNVVLVQHWSEELKRLLPPD